MRQKLYSLGSPPGKQTKKPVLYVYSKVQVRIPSLNITVYFSMFISLLFYILCTSLCSVVSQRKFYYIIKQTVELFNLPKFCSLTSFANRGRDCCHSTTVPLLQRHISVFPTLKQEEWQFILDWLAWRYLAKVKKKKNLQEDLAINL